jgi:hypothetical protein
MCRVISSLLFSAFVLGSLSAQVSDTSLLPATVIDPQALSLTLNEALNNDSKTDLLALSEYLTLTSQTLVQARDMLIASQDATQQLILSLQQYEDSLKASIHREQRLRVALGLTGSGLVVGVVAVVALLIIR